jgi:hypothetical protein
MIFLIIYKFSKQGLLLFLKILVHILPAKFCVTWGWELPGFYKEAPAGPSGPWRDLKLVFPQFILILETFQKGDKTFLTDYCSSESESGYVHTIHVGKG